MNNVAAAVAGLIGARWLAQVWLEQLNVRHAGAHATELPAELEATTDPATRARAIAYTRAHGRFNQLRDTCDALLLLAVLFTGLLPWAWAQWTGRFGGSPRSTTLFLLGVGVVLALPELPLAWFEQFRIEQRFGFNTSTQRTWWLDRLKGGLLALALGYVLLRLVLTLMAWGGSGWWLWAWAGLVGMQLLLSLLAPVLIPPLFNRFTPLPAGPLRDRLLALARRTEFRVGDIVVMDGSRRSRHSNAFFTGLGRFRKIALFDTLVAGLGEDELEAVLAHEIGHARLRHLAQRLVGMAAAALLGLYAVAWLGGQPWLPRAFGFEPGHPGPILLLFGLLAGVLTFWFTPLLRGWSRRHEHQADAFAARTLGDAQPLVRALRRLNAQNLANLTPHPVYSRFYYSHPTPLERERALQHFQSGKAGEQSR